MVTTIEPGIYFIQGLFDEVKLNDKIKDYFNFDKIKEYMDVGGVRLEDNIVVTPSGYKVMTNCPRTTEEIEKCMAG